MRNLLGLSLGLVCAASLVGCSNDTGGSDPVEVEHHTFAPGQGQSPTGSVAYAPGPYGIGKGSTMANYQFVGFANAQAPDGTNGLKAIEMSHFYNPTGADVYPEGSPYGAGSPKPKALLIDVASVWCGPCNQEAATVLPAKHKQFKPMGGEFLLQLADGPNPGTPATSKNLFNWVTKYKVDYPATIDPSSKLGALFEADAFPTNMIIRTKDMKIIQVIAGVPDPAFWSTFQKVAAGEL